LTQQLAWPARTSLPELAYLVSELQQKTPTATVADLGRANFVLKQARLGVEGSLVRFKKLPNDEPWMVVAFHDASFGGRTNNGSQQGYVVAISTTKALEESRPMNAVDWSSSKIHRVVRSTLAAEAAAASHCHDRAVYARAMLSELDIKTSKESWTTEIKKIPCVQVSDCRSLVDHCAKTGGSVSEKRVALDIADLRAAVEHEKD